MFTAAVSQSKVGSCRSESVSCRAPVENLCVVMCCEWFAEKPMASPLVE